MKESKDCSIAYITKGNDQYTYVDPYQNDIDELKMIVKSLEAKNSNLTFRLNKVSRRTKHNTTITHKRTKRRTH